MQEGWAACFDGSSGDVHGFDAVALHWAAWAEGRLLVERTLGGEGDAAARLQWVRALAAQAQVRECVWMCVCV
jgi:hypothetical protein